MKIHTTPFLTSWPAPFRLRDFMNCFKSGKTTGKLKVMGSRASQKIQGINTFNNFEASFSS